jgi:hypothetical protein
MKRSKEKKCIHDTTKFIANPIAKGDKSFIHVPRDCSFITLRGPCNNHLPRCDIAWLHVTNHLYMYHVTVVLLLSGGHVIITDVDGILHGFMLQIIYTCTT